MELDELKTAWKEMDRKLAASMALNVKLFREMKVDKIRAALRRVGLVVASELVLALLMVLWVGSFIAHHFRETRFLVAAMMLQAVAIVSIWFCVRDLARLGDIDYAAPVVKIQKQMAELRASRTWLARLQLLSWPVLWAPAVVVILRAAGMQRTSETLWRWFWLNVLAGVGMALMGAWMVRLGEKDDAPRWLKDMSDNIAGRSVARASALVEEIAEFEKEV